MASVNSSYVKTVGGKQIYTTSQGDMFDIIAYKVYGDAYFMSDIIRANPGLCDIFVFSAGTELIIPEISSPSSDMLPPWRRNGQIKRE